MKNNSVTIYLPVYLLIALLPFLTLLREVVYIGISANFTLFGMLKEILVIIFILACLCNLMLSNKVIELDNNISFLLMFICYGLLHFIITTAEMSNAINNFRLMYLNVMLCITLYLYYINTRKQIRYDYILNIILASAIGVALFGVYEKFVNPDIIRLYKITYSTVVTNLGIPGFPRARIASTLGNPINLGLFLMVGLLAAIYRLENSQRKLSSFLYILCAFFFIFVSIFTLSRTAYGCCVISLGIYFGYKLFNSSISKLKAVTIMVTVILAVVALIMMTSGNTLILLRLMQSIDLGTIATDPRLAKWDVIIKQLFNDPITFLWGLGLGNSGTSGLTKKFVIIENSFVSLIYELGLIGLIMFLAIIGRFLFNTMKMMKSNNIKIKSLGLIFFIYVATFIFSSMFMDAHINNPFSVYFWVFLSIAQIVMYEQKKGWLQDNGICNSHSIQ